MRSDCTIGAASQEQHLMVASKLFLKKGRIAIKQRKKEMQISFDVEVA